MQEDVMPIPEGVHHPLYTQEGREATPAALQRGPPEAAPSLPSASDARLGGSLLSSRHWGYEMLLHTAPWHVIRKAAPP